MLKNRKIGVVCLVVMMISGLSLFAEGQKEVVNEKVTLTVWDFKYSEEVVGSALKDMDALYLSKNPL